MKLRRLGQPASPPLEKIQLERTNTPEPDVGEQKQASDSSQKTQDSELLWSTRRSKSPTGPLAFLDDSQSHASFPVAQWIKTLPAQEINNLISSLNQEAASLSPEQNELLASLNLHALSLSERSALSDELLLQSALQAIRGGNVKSPSITLRVIQQLQELAQQENLSPENYQAAYPMPFIKVAGLEALTNPALLPLLPRLAEAAEPLKQYLKPVPIESEETSKKNISDQIHSQIEKANQFSQSLGEDISLELEALQDRIDDQELRQQSLELEMDGVGLLLELAEKRLAATEVELSRSDVEPMKRAELNLDKIRYAQQIQKFERQQSELQVQSHTLSTDFEMLKEQLEQNAERIEETQKLSDYQGLSQEQREVLGLRETALAEMGRVMQDHAAGFTAHVEKLLQPGESQGNIKLEQDLNFTFSQIFDPKNWTQLEAFNTALQGGIHTLSDSEKEALKHFGLYSHQGKLINLVNRQPLTEEQLSALRATCEQYQCSRNLEQDAASAVTTQILETASTNLQGVQAIRERLSQLANELELATQRLESSNSQIETLLQEAAELTESTQQFQTRLENITDIVTQLRQRRDERGLKEYLRQLAASGQLDALKNELSDFLGVDLEVNGNQVRFSFNGNKVSPEAFVRLLEVRLRLKNNELESMQSALTLKHAEIESSRQQLHTDQANLRATCAQTQETAQEYRTALTESKADLQQLIALRDDPMQWNQFNENEQQEILTKISELQAEHALAPAVFERLDQLFTRSDTALERAAENLDLAALVLNQIEDLLFALNALTDRIAQLLEGVFGVTPESEIEILGHDLFKRLADLEPQELEQSMTSWLETLREAYARADRQMADEAAEAEISAAFIRQQSSLKQQALKHHIQQLEAIDERRRAFTQEQVGNSLQQFLTHSF